MTKEQAEIKLALMPLTAPVIVSYQPDMEDETQQRLTFTTTNGNIQVPLAPGEIHLETVVNNLPLAASNRLACLAIMLAPALPVSP